MFNGYKTYIVAILLIIASVAQSLGYLTSDTFALVLGILAPTGLMTLRSAVNRD